MRLAAAAVIFLTLVASPQNASAEEEACRAVSGQAFSVLHQCGNVLKSFSLSLSEIKLPQTKRAAVGDMHGRYGFPCPVEFMCEGEPLIGGYFFDPESWQKSVKDDEAILQVMRRIPMLPKDLEKPAWTCPVFDVSIDGMNGRAICIGGQDTSSAIIVVAADDRVGFVLSFSQEHQSANALRDKVIELLSRFGIERASGDAALLRWMR